MGVMIDRDSAGVFAVAPTPFTTDGALDLDSTDRMVDFYLESGVNGITILGIMGEAPKLTSDEAEIFARHVLKRVAGRVPVVVGVSAAGLDPMNRLAQTVIDAGAGGVMVAPQPGLSTETKVQGYLAAVWAKLGDGIPICFQDDPHTTGVHVSVDTIRWIAANLSQVVMLNHEDWPGLTKLSALRGDMDDGKTPRLSILTGNSALFLPQELQRGADGAMTGFPYPEMMVQVVARHKAGDMDGAEDVFDAYLPLVRYEQQLGLGLAIRKEVLARRGILASPKVRAPGPGLTPYDHIELSRLIARLEKRLKELG